MRVGVSTSSAAATRDDRQANENCQQLQPTHRDCRAQDPWGRRRVRVVDAGDHLVIEPVPDDPIDRVCGSVCLPEGMSTDTLRTEGREEDAADEQRVP